MLDGEMCKVTRECVFVDTNMPPADKPIHNSLASGAMTLFPAEMRPDTISICVCHFHSSAQYLAMPSPRKGELNNEE